MRGVGSQGGRRSGNAPRSTSTPRRGRERPGALHAAAQGASRPAPRRFGALSTGTSPATTRGAPCTPSGPADPAQGSVGAERLRISLVDPGPGCTRGRALRPEISTLAGRAHCEDRRGAPGRWGGAVVAQGRRRTVGRQGIVVCPESRHPSRWLGAHRSTIPSAAPRPSLPRACSQPTDGAAAPRASFRSRLTPDASRHPPHRRSVSGLPAPGRRARDDARWLADLSWCF